MNARRGIVVLVVALSLAGMVAVGHVVPTRSAPVFAKLGSPSMPFVPSGSFVTSSWFCPGVPNGGDGLGGSVVVANPGDELLTGRVTVFSSEPDVASVSRPVEVSGRGRVELRLADLQPVGSFLSAMVEIDNGGGVVEQMAQHPAGRSIAACSNATSSNWYFAEGFTVGGSSEQLVLTNPYADTATVSIGFATASATGERRPPAFQGFPVPAGSVRVIELASLGFRNEPVVAVQVNATRGRVVAGRQQHYVGGGRLGASMTLGAASLASTEYFADGESGGSTISERYSLYNPTDDAITVSAVFLGVALSDAFANDSELDVPAHSVVTFDPSTVEGLPVGRHAVVFSTLTTASMVVERALVRSTGSSSSGNGVVTVVGGAPDTSASTRWTMGIGTDVAVDGALVVLNIDGLDGTVTVAALGPGGLLPVPGLEGLPIPAGAIVTIPLTDPGVIGKSLVVSSTRQVYVERLFTRGAGGAGRTGSFALRG